MNYIKEIAVVLAKAAAEFDGGFDEKFFEDAIEVPSDYKKGDYAFPCFKLSKPLKKPPVAIAGELKQRIGEVCGTGFESVSADGPYLNFFVDRAEFARRVVSRVLDEGEEYGGGVCSGGTVVIDYSSPNVTHEFHIGHLMSTAIGAAIYRAYKFLGYRTVGVNYLGDWGAQFGKLVCAYKKWSAPELLEDGGMEEVTRIYVKFHDEAEVDPGLLTEARAWLVKMEAGDDEALSAWVKLKEICIAEMEKVYERLGVSFDLYRGESYYNGRMMAVVDKIAEKGLLVLSDGAKIVDLEAYKMPPCLILRSDGGTLYPTRDMAAAFDRYNEFRFDKSIYVTDMRQSLHFAQFFKVIELMGEEFADRLVHVPYGLLSLETGPLASRKGNVVLLKDLFDESAKRAEKIIEEKNPELLDRKATAEQVGIGAVVFATLYNQRIKDVVFSWEKALNFEGETGPYVQYTHARACGILAKSGGEDIGDPDFSLLTGDDEFLLIKALAEYPARILESAEKCEPYLISRVLVLIAQAFNKFYHDNPILQSEPEVRRARLATVVCVRDVLKAGLGILGIQAPEKM